MQSQRDKDIAELKEIVSKLNGLLDSYEEGKGTSCYWQFFSTRMLEIKEWMQRVMG